MEEWVRSLPHIRDARPTGADGARIGVPGVVDGDPDEFRERGALQYYARSWDDIDLLVYVEADSVCSMTLDVSDLHTVEIRPKDAPPGATAVETNQPRTPILFLRKEPPKPDGVVMTHVRSLVFPRDEAPFC